MFRQNPRRDVPGRTTHPDSERNRGCWAEADTTPDKEHEKSRKCLSSVDEREAGKHCLTHVRPHAAVFAYIRLRWPPPLPASGIAPASSVGDAREKTGSRNRQHHPA